LSSVATKGGTPVRYQFLMSVFRLLDPERAHALALWALHLGLAGGAPARGHAALGQRLWGRDFPNPLGLAAGFDKDATAVQPLLDLGFGFIEVGSITPEPQPGNPKPRLFRLPEARAVINRMGFNSGGLAAAQRRLAAWRATGGGGIVGINLGKNRESDDAAADYAAGTRALGPLADYLVINVSSPNTPGLRGLQAAETLRPLVASVLRARGEATADAAPPLLLKVAPDLTAEERQAIVEIALAAPVEGLIVSNTTVARPPELGPRWQGEAGGLSGRPLYALSTEVLADFYRLSEGRLPIIGVGGVEGRETAYGKIRAGASLVQLYTALIYEGPGLVTRILDGLTALLEKDGFSHISQAVGADHHTRFK
jgi:dihydroorotate dehydrogenase